MNGNNTTKDNENKVSIHIDFIAKDRLKKMQTMEKIRLIIDSVKDQNAVVLESGLTPEEESKLVEMTMQQIDPDTGFSGLEIERYNRHETETGFLSKLLPSSDEKSRMTIIGPANKLQTVENDDMMQAIISGD